MNILGLNAYHADSSACLIKDGELIAATEEERFTRIKHWAGFPAQAIKFCLDEADVKIQDVDYITIGRDPKAKLFEKVWYSISNTVSPKGIIDRLKNQKQAGSLEEEFLRLFKIEKKDLKARIYNIEHHRSHMASAFFASPFEDSAILTLDGSGDFTTTMRGEGHGTKIKVFDSVSYPVSLGLFYTAFTQFLGFPYYGDEYKVMGLAPYGSPVYKDKIEKLLIRKNGLFTWDKSFFRNDRDGIPLSYENNLPDILPLYSKKFIKEFGEPREKNEPLSQYHKDLASSVQKVTEELIFYLAEELHKKTGQKNICIAGGVAQNSVANGKLLENTSFEKVYIPSAGHDAGNSIGSALYLYNHILSKERIKPIYSAYTGIRFGNESIQKILESKNIKYKLLNDTELYEYVSNKLIDAGVIGWFQGRAEFGPRALGARSIIVDPRREDAKDLLNKKIKRRESFRPFAPSILKEYVKEYFTVVDEVPFMEKVFPIKKEKHSVIPAVTHVDGTGRLQTVDKLVSPSYYKLIDKFREKTGVPILLNTSFNENEPIVNTPEEALDCFLRTKMDMLVMENIVIER